MNNDIKSIIQADFDKKQSVNSRYSLRAYASYLGLSPASLSKILSNKVEVSPKILKQIAPKLNLTPAQYNKLEDSLKKIKKSNSIKFIENEGIRKLQMEEFNFISDWYHFAILEIFNLDHYDDSPEWIAKKLGIDEAKVEAALDRLINLKLLEYDNKGHIVLSSDFTSVLDYSFSSTAMRERQKQIMKLSSSKIDMVNIEKRDNSSLTITVDEKLIPEIKDKIKNFRRTLGNYIVKNSKKRTGIYELQISFIPLTED